MLRKTNRPGCCLLRARYGCRILFSSKSKPILRSRFFNEHITGTLTLYVRRIPKDGSSSPNEPQVSEGSLVGTAVARTNRVRARQPLPRCRSEERRVG